jgi:DNA recombination protein RmuC
MDTTALLLAAATLIVGLLVGLLLRRRPAAPAEPAEAPEVLADRLANRLAGELRREVEDRLRTEQATAEARERAAQEAIQRLVEPLREGMAKLDVNVKDLEKARAGAYARLDEQVVTTFQRLDELKLVTQRLDGAMRSNQARGAWGELQLQRIVELTGLKEHVSYAAQVQQVGDGSGRPDLTVHLTDGKVLYIDAKAPMASFLRALEEQDRAAQKPHLVQHAKDLLQHARAVADRGYRGDGASIDLVVVFVPNEAALAAALDADPDLLGKALELRVVLTGPTSLAMLLTNVSASWRQQALAENAEKVVSEVLTLHERLGTFLGHLGKVGAALDRSVDAFNRAVGSFERRVLPAARRVEELTAMAEADRLDDLAAVEAQPTLIAGDVEGDDDARGATAGATVDAADAARS